MKKIFKTHTKEKITAIAFIIVIFTMMIGMVTTTHDLGEGFILNYRLKVPTGAPVIERLKGAIESAEQAVNEGAFLRQQYVELYGLSQLVMQKHAVIDYNYGALYKTRDGQTTFSVQEERYIDDAANATYPLVNGLIHEGVDFLYVQLPFKVQPAKFGGDRELPVYVHDYANENADRFVETMRAANIACYDTRDEFFGSGLSMKELFFKTDHHWSIKGAFLGTGLIANYLNENYGFDIPEGLYSEENFVRTTYPKSFIGSMGRRVGRIYGGIDDFTLYSPDFETDITVTKIEGISEVTTRGAFEDVVLEMQYIDNPDPTTNRYAVYHGDYQELRFVNNLVDNDNSVLIIKDSFGLPVYSFLSLGIHEVRAIDMRIFEKNVLEYAAEYHPDLVILMYNCDSYVDPMFDFNM